ncbi:hypothetical protein CURE108131_05475 [Cupriavidus respiraculi]|uniref:Glycosyltransferase RgtA/B/C/D-like domain-containing protein n=1 Tax=Cupriavidus respiraculi TaxID=195930 RepID=A0ABM8XCH6_9BURK|nr:hypothetical protein [Cupriavidus respiraculi]CAG9177798.1 hypothetical protein LMG21510_03398 [Cupriavidus respiraculi]
MKSLLSRGPWPYTDESAGAFLCRRASLLLASLVIAAWCAYGAYQRMDRPQAYSELIVGNIAWSLSNKYHDYAALFAFVFGTLASFVLLCALSARVARQIGSLAEARFQDFLAMTAAPAGLWLAGLLTTRDTDLRNLAVAGALAGMAAVFAFVLQMRGHAFWQQDEARFARILQKSVLALAVIGFGVAAVGLLVSRGGLVFPFPEVRADRVYFLAVRAMVVGAIAVIALVLTSRTAAALESRLDTLILGSQVVYPAYFMMLIPVPWRVAGKLVLGYPLSTAGFAFIGICVLLTLAAVLARFRTVRRAAVPMAPSGLLVLPAAIGVLLFLKTFPVGVASISPDDYHFGEMVAPWWSLAQHHLIPFWDYSPARGLMNYLPGLTATLFFDGTAATYDAAAPFLYVAVLAVAMPAVAATIGRGPAILALFLAPYINWISEIDIVVTAFLCVLCTGYLRWTAVRWLATAWCAALALLLYAPGQGALAIVSVTPLALAMLYRAFRDDRTALIRMLVALLAVTALLAWLTPFGHMLLGAIRYGTEQSGVNSIAHGVNWSATFGKSDANPWLYEVARCSWLLVAMLAGVLLLRQIMLKSTDGRAAAFAFLVPIFILMVVFVIRAAGRIDPSAATRLGIASVWGLALLLPILIFAVMRPRAPGVAVLLWVSAAGLIVPYFGGWDRHYLRAFEPLNGPAGLPGYVEGRSVGLPELGNGVADGGHLDRLIRIRQTLDRVLEPHETYLDMTGRHATYFYFNRRPPIETGSVYNLVTERQQLRAIASLRHERPPVVLISADNIVHDGGPASLRANLLYRFLMLETGYKVVTFRNLVWLMRPDRVVRLAPEWHAEISELSDAPSNPVNAVFRVPNLQWIPASWGRSAATLEPRMRTVQRLPADATAIYTDVVREPDGAYRVTGADPHITFDISSWGLAGRQAGIVGFDFSCEAAGPPPVIEFYWATDRTDESEGTVLRFNGRSGRILVPVDSAPAWLLAKQIRRIRFDVGSPESCRSFRVDNIRLNQRPGIDDKTD